MSLIPDPSSLTLFDRAGQSLAEIVIGLGIATVFLIGSAVIIAPSLQVNKQVGQVQTKTELADELLNNTKAWAGENWNGVLSVATGSGNPYYLNTATSPFTLSTSTQQVTVSGVAYTRYFYLSDVYRDNNGNVTTTVSGNNYDPSTKQITIVVGATSVPTSTYVSYLTRNFTSVFNQTSWAGGSGQTAPVKVASNVYAASANVTIISGQIELATGGGGSCVQ